MADIKHTFTSGKMNKDLDERLVPNGEYRDALNIEIVSSSSGNIGSASTMRGTKELLTRQGQDINSTIYRENSKFIGSISDEKTNRSFFFVTPSFKHNATGHTSGVPHTAITSKRLWKDMIVCYNDDIKTLEPVVVDIFEVHDTVNNAITSGLAVDINITQLIVSGSYINCLKPGMSIDVYDSNGVIGWSQDAQNPYPKISSINKIPGSSDYSLILDGAARLSSQVSNENPLSTIRFKAPRVLNFRHEKHITGISIVRDLLFWTDNNSEPKKINITRSIAGSSDFDTNTKLFITNPTAYNSEALTGIDVINSSNYGNLLEEHITVIKKPPRKAPRLNMSGTLRSGNINGVVNLSGQLFDDLGNVKTPGNTFQAANISNVAFGTYVVGDTIIFSKSDPDTGGDKEVRGEIIEWHPYGSPEIPAPYLVLTLMSIDANITSSDDVFTTILEQPKAMFEFKFGRFASRYKYEDGEYSSFSPWSELAFLPGGFDYEPKEGYNLGMVNNLRELTLHNFIDYDVHRPADVVAVDVLYKESMSPNVYVVKSITRGRDPEWVSSVDDNDTVSLEITSEMIHSVLPSNQSLRVWDNVPRKALAQEITGSRLLYGNYTQGYDKPSALSLHQVIVSKSFLEEIDKVNSILDSNLGALPSMKSLRKYKVGVVLGDAYGRETPVISTGTRVISSGDKIIGDINVGKKESSKQNKLLVQQHWDNSISSTLPPDWAEYCKYYVKETSGEYYNLSMDRVYDAEDSNIWLSFMSHDRNKVDIDTYLILKKTHKSNTAVTDPARYKVLAVENDAPEHIKTEHRVICELEPPAGINGDALYSYNSLTWTDSLASAVFRGFKSFKGTGFARILLDNNNAANPKTYKSAWKKISRANDNGGIVGIGITVNSTHLQLVDTNFGNTAKLDETITNEGGTPDLDTWRIEIKDTVVTNRPEFDGRFFVKIHRDDVLENSVVANITTDTEYIPNTFFNIGHISTKHNWVGSGGIYATPPEWIGDANTGIANGWQTNEFAGQNVEASFGNCGGDGAVFEVDNGDQQRTREFWENQSSGSSPSLFIDNSKAIQNPRDINNNYIVPQGISEGDHGPNSRIHISWIKGDADDQITNIGTSEENIFPNHHMAVGKLFRFHSDPDHRIYRITKSIVGTNRGRNFHKTQFWAFYDDDATSDSCEECWEEDHCGRHTVELHFECVADDSGLSNLNLKGIDVARWDPRGDARFDGKTASCNIETMTAFVPSHEPVPASIDSAIWETEPKEGPNLDIYYEASNAIPMKLTNKTINDFAPLDSVISLSRDGISDTLFSWHLSYGTSVGTLNTAPLLNDGLPPSGRTHVKILSNKDNTITVGSANQDDGSDVRKLKAGAVGGLVSIDNRDGTITQSSITGHATIDANGVVIKNDPVTFITCGLINRFTSGVYDHSEVIIPWSLYGTQEEVIALIDGKVLEIGNEHGPINPGTTTTSSASDTPMYTVSGSTMAVRVNKHFGSLGIDGVPVVDGFLPNSYDLKFTEVTGTYILDPDVYKYKVQLPYHNCYVFGNGVESDRIRDDFNAPTIGKGFKASTTLVDYDEEVRSSGMIYSGIYNSTSGVNQLNEFNMAEAITKDLNPIYGPIQALKTRDTNVVAFCEDKVLKILANKDALFNADGSTNVTASSNVLGSSIAFSGDYGISSNPESLAADGYRLYFTDKQRGKVLRLSQDGLTPISDVGMTNYFRDNLKDTDTIVGTYDEILGEYNVTLKYPRRYNSPSPVTLSFNEKTKGWTSFRSYTPDSGVSINNKYITGNNGKLWEHHNSDVNANNFYNTQYTSTIDILFNDEPSVIKSFKSVGYEGSQAKVNQFTTQSVTDAAGISVTANDGMYSNLSGYSGWYVSSFNTDKQEGVINEFIEKEGKWFNNMSGVETTIDNLDTSEFTVQGIGFVKTVTLTGTQDNHTLTIQNDPNQ